ncbi:MAG: DUF4160 domain-containing protein [Chloroflexi bacterium]|nr:DUF4160 domain-containing protein [Chloroflexota bacterium]
MPVLSMFYGIVIRMYFFDDQQHHVPHLHAEYAGKRAVFSISDGELLADWRLAVDGEEVFKVEPLK